MSQTHVMARIVKSQVMIRNTVKLMGWGGGGGGGGRGGAYMSYTHVIPRMYQASHTPWPLPRVFRETAITRRAQNIWQPACRNRARRPKVSAVQKET